MSQRFTVELKRMPLHKATVEVVADDMADAHRKALAIAGGPRLEVNGLWTIEYGQPLVVKITAHAGSVE